MKAILFVRAITVLAAGGYIIATHQLTDAGYWFVALPLCFIGGNLLAGAMNYRRDY